MPPIKILDDSVKKAFEELNATMLFTVSTLKTLTKEAVEMQAALKGANINQLTEAQNKYNIANQQSITEQKQLIELETKRQQLIIAEQKAINAKADAERKATKEAERQAAAAEKQANKSAELTSAYAKESRQLTELRNKAKDIAITYGTSSKEFKKAADEVTKLDAKLKNVDATLGQHQRNVGNYGSGLNKVIGFLGQFGLALGAVSLIQAGWNKIIGASQITADKFEETMAGLNNSIDYMASAVSNGSFKNFFANLERSYQAGVKFAQIMDRLGDQEAGLESATAEASVQIVEQQKIYKDATKSNEERLKAINNEIEIEQKLLKAKTELRKEGYDAVVESIFNADAAVNGYTDAKKAEYQQGLNNIVYATKELDILDKLREAEKGLTATKAEYTATLGGSTMTIVADVEARKKARIEVDNLRASIAAESPELLKSVDNWKAWYDNFPFNDEKRSQIVNAYKEWRTAQASIQGAENDLLKKKSALINEYIKENTQTRDLIKLKEQEINKRKEVEATTKDEILQRNEDVKVLEKELALLKQFGEIVPENKPIKQKTKTENITVKYDEELFKPTELEKLNKEATDFGIAELNRYLKAQKEANDKRIELEKEVTQAQKELQAEAIYSAAEIYNSAIDSQLDKLDEQSEKIEESYDKRLENESLSDAQIVQLEKEKQKELEKIEKQKSKLEKQRFLVTQSQRLAETIMNTQAAVMAALLEPHPYGEAIAATRRIQGALAVATILAQTAMYDSGTKSAPNEFIAGELRPEIMRLTTGETMLVDQPTYFKGQKYKGAEIISGAETAKILNNKFVIDAISNKNNMSNTDNAQLLLALKRLDSSVKKQSMSVKINSIPDIKTTAWYKKIRN